MTDEALVDTATGVAVSGRRAEVLARLRESPEPPSAAQVAEQLSLHRNTARFHLDGLVEDGLVERSAEQRQTPGRPRIVYRARAQVPGDRSYGLLAEILTGLVASLDSAGPAVLEAGRAWGRHLVERSPPSEQVGPEEAIARLRRVLKAVGFQPQLHTGTDGLQIKLHNCPFREVATRHTDVVCAIHLGMMQGALAEQRAPVDAESLEPFVTPTLCVAQLRAPADLVLPDAQR
jgi:predicted ArsR family transcriptional regulator